MEATHTVSVLNYRLAKALKELKKIDKKSQRYGAGSAVASYQRHLGRLEERRLAAQRDAASEWVGTQKERLRKLRMTCTMAQGISTEWGESVLYKFRDDAGNVFSWFSSGGCNLDPNKIYLMDATVKRHSEYLGIKETQISRAKVLEQLTP